MKKTNVVRHYYVLPCCLLLLNLVNNVISYKASEISDGLLRTTVVILLVLFGSSVVAFAVAPGLQNIVRSLHQRSRKGAGELGEILFLILLGVLVFWLYYQMTVHGVETIIPSVWRNSVL